MEAPLRCTFRPELPTDVGLTLRPLQRGAADPATQAGPGWVVRAMRTPLGPVTLRLGSAAGEVTAEAWGPGSSWALERAPEIVGSRDSLAGFAPEHPVLAQLHRRLSGLRLCRPAGILDALVVAVLEQKVTSHEAVRAWVRMVHALGTPAPGPWPRLRVPPSGEVLASTPYWRFHAFGVERRRADVLRLAGARAAWLEQCSTLPLPQVSERLTSLPGIGAWTDAQVRLYALGDADAVIVGDYNLPHLVTWALAGERRGDDTRMLELLARYAGHRGRVQRLLVAGGAGPPRRAPHMAIRDFATY